MFGVESFDRNGGAPPGRGRRRTGPHRFDQIIRPNGRAVTNGRTNDRLVGTVKFNDDVLIGTDP